jgi:hypothetical protein
MMGTERKMDIDKPAVYIYSDGKTDAIAIKEIGAGLEEESVPYKVYIHSERNKTVIDASNPHTGTAGRFITGSMASNSIEPYKTLAFLAAQDSPLHVGVGVTENGAAMTMEGIPPQEPVFCISFTNNLSVYKAKTTEPDNLPVYKAKTTETDKLPVYKAKMTVTDLHFENIQTDENFELLNYLRNLGKNAARAVKGASFICR